MADDIEKVSRIADENKAADKKPADKKDKKSAKKKDARGNRLVRWFREMRADLKKVTWPTPRQIMNNTLVSLAVIAVSSIVIWGVDYASGAIFTLIRTIFSKV